MKVLLQFPEGLKQYGLEYAKKLEEKGDEVYISASPTFGACDIAVEEAKKIGAEKIVHFGHAEFMHIDFNVEYVEYSINADLSILKESLPLIEKFRKIGIVTTVQHVAQLEDIKNFYEKNGKEVIIGRPYGFARHNGQILGCDVGSAASIDREVECFIYFGGGLFHPLGAVYQTTKPFLSIEPFAHKMEWLDDYREKHRREVNGKILKSFDAKRFGILVSTKIGQYNLNLAKVLKERIEKAGSEAAILVSNTFDFDSLNNMMEIDAFVNTACPRLATEDTDRLRKPLLNANELITLLDMRKQKQDK
ncbi:MAG: diphthamide biosynthesis enzyme Dph2 [Candidatus Micrarchaeia archaeon]